jgi:hypothetical protein
MRIRNPAHNKGGSYTLAGRRGGGGQYFGRRETGLPSCNNNLSTIRITVCMFTILQVNDTVRSGAPSEDLLVQFDDENEKVNVKLLIKTHLMGRICTFEQEIL